MSDSQSSPSFVEEFDFQRCLNVLKEGYENKEFNKVFRNHLKVYVPVIFKSFKNWTVLSTDESRLTEKLIFNVFNSFILTGNSSDLFTNLKNAEEPSILCAKVFKLGEPTYSCRDCGVDPTCVLCIECFQNSSHKHHKYRMSTSGGGGYCDCGDREAWKSEPFCDTHQASKTQPEDMANDPLNNETKSKLSCLFVSLTEYILEMVTLDNMNDLPMDLQSSNLQFVRGKDEFLTMLYNDEVHTYDQVTKVLKEAIHCNENKAVEYATIVDREGRAIVKIGEKEDCNNVKKIIEQATTFRTPSFSNLPERKPLKVTVVCPVVFAHQTFAGCAAQWLKKLIQDYGALRNIFAELSLKIPEGFNSSMLERTILEETKMWKSVRNQMRHLFMTGIFMNPTLKKEFSIVFTRVYDVLINSHVLDDHEIMYSALCESVQIFTVPSLARFLITEHNLLKVLINTFYKECQLLVKDGVFKPDLQDPYSRFKRSLCVLQDIKYALLVPPEVEEWNDRLLINFLDAFQSFLKILEVMEGMDSITRQVDNHVEYELEWEHAFNFQFRFMELYSQVAAWCKSDENILEKSINMCITIFLNKQLPNDSFEFDCVTVDEIRLEGVKKMDFTTFKISIHQPLARMLINLFVCYNYVKQDVFQQQQEQRQQDNKRFELLDLKERDIVDLWRPSLSVAVFEAQVNANMWRRNGLVVQNQVYYYRNVRCRSSMFDMDTMYMQFAASLLAPNDFLMMMIYYFGLSNWARFEYDTEVTPYEAMKQIISLAESMLNWILVIYCERYVVGVGKVDFKDIVKYEVVHNLCIQPMAYSELTNSISDVIRQPDKERDLEDLIKEVANFKKPTSSLGKGLYEVKQEHYKLYNPFYYHYSKVDKTKSEENVRNHLKKHTESPCIHLPEHDLPAFSGVFCTIPDLLQADVFLHMVRLVLKRSSTKVSKSWSEGQLEKMLFLVGYAMREEEKRLKMGQPCGFVKKCLEVPSNSSVPCASVLQLLQCLLTVQSLQHPHIKALIATTHAKLQELASAECMLDGTTPMPPHLSAQCDKTSTAGVKSAGGLTEAQERSEKGRLKRERVMANMSKQQVMFIKENQELFESTSTEAKENANRKFNNDEALEDVVMTQPIALGLKRSLGVAHLSRQTCILCQEDQEISWSEAALVYCSFMQKSSVLSTDRSKCVPPTNLTDHDPLFADATLSVGVYTSTCGHVMHASCWKLFFESLQKRDVNRNRMRVHHRSYESSMKEFLCPMCETICNCVLPLIPSLTTLNKEWELKNVDLTLDEWLDGILKTVENSVRQEKDDEDGDDSFFFVPCPLSTVTKMMAEGVACRFHAIFDYMIADNSSAFSKSIVEMLKKFAQDIFERTLGDSSVVDDNDDRVIATLWNTCSYSIMSIENVLRAEGKALFGSLPSKQAECIGTLIRLAAISSSIFPDDVVKKRCIRLLSELTSCRRMRGIFRLDMFHCLVSLCLSLPTLYIHSPDHESLDAAEASTSVSPPASGGGSGGGGVVGAGRKGIKILATPSGRVNESNALKFMLGHHILQIMLSITEESNDCGEGGEDGPDSSIDFESDMNTDPAVHLIGESVLDEEDHEMDSVPAKDTDLEMEVDEMSDCEELLRICNGFRKEGKLSDVRMTAEELMQHIKTSALPFLRCSSLFFHYLTSVPAPLKLFDESNCEFDIICEYLDLPTHLSSIFTLSANLNYILTNNCHNVDADASDTQSTSQQHPPAQFKHQQFQQQHSQQQQFQQKQFHHQQKKCKQQQVSQKQTKLQQSRSTQPPQSSRMRALMKGVSKSAGIQPPCNTQASIFVMHFPRKPNKLLDLPTHYSQLINQFSMFTCPKFNSVDESRSPAMCLVCGIIVCSQSYCCQVKLGSKVVGAAMAHSYSCGAGSGIFIRVRDCQIMMLNGMTRGCFTPPPYLDEHGETDEGLRRGNPLYLCEERYEQLQKLWLNHSIPEEIVHKLELMPNFSATYDWHNF